MFNEKAYFSDAMFNEADFSGATFSDLVSFRFASFLAYALFDRAKFLGEVDFYRTKFCPVFSDIDRFVLFSFRGAWFKEQQRTVFDRVDMDWISLLYVNLDRIVFRNIDWREIYDARLFIMKYSRKELEKYLETRRKCLEKFLKEVMKEIEELKKKESLSRYEEDRLKFLKKGKEKIEENIRKIDEYLKGKGINLLMERILSEKDVTFENVLSVVRGLRENYDYYLNYEVAGRFFLQEMELRRRIPMLKMEKNLREKMGKIRDEKVDSKIKRLWKKIRILRLKTLYILFYVKMALTTSYLPLTLYKLISLYGESPGRACLSFLIFLIFFSTIYLALFYNQLGSIFQCIWISFRAAFQYPVEMELPYYNDIVLIQRILSPILLAMLTLSLKRKYERRIRH